MGSSDGNLDYIVRSKRKAQNFAVISALFACLFSIGIIAVNFRLMQLNQGKMDQLTQEQNAIKKENQASSNLQKDLKVKHSEIEELKKLLNAEKALTQSLKGKLANTLKLLADTRELVVKERNTDNQPVIAPASAVPESNEVENKIPKMNTPSNAVNSASTLPDSNSLENKMFPAKPSLSESPGKKPLAESRDDEASQSNVQINTSMPTSKNIEPVQLHDDSIKTPPVDHVNIKPSGGQAGTVTGKPASNRISVDQ